MYAASRQSPIPESLVIRVAGGYGGAGHFRLNDPLRELYGASGLKKQLRPVLVEAVCVSTLFFRKPEN